MSEEVAIDSVVYISSKRASDSSGYTRDYIGQLARKCVIEAQRVGGLWYVSAESLLTYKRKADAYTSPQPVKTENRSESADSIIAFDGSDYISSIRASEITGYHADYVGQLAREGKILSRQIGNRWFVDRAGIEAHKEEKDALLAAVQANSVGLPGRHRDREVKIDKIQKEKPLFNYVSDTNPLMPEFRINHKKEESIEAANEEETSIAIRVMNTKKRTGITQRKGEAPKYHIKRRIPRISLFLGSIGVVILAITAVAIGIVYVTSLRNIASNTISKINSTMMTVGERYLTTELIYIRKAKK